MHPEQKRTRPSASGLPRLLDAALDFILQSELSTTSGAMCQILLVLICQGAAFSHPIVDPPLDHKCRDVALVMVAFGMILIAAAETTAQEFGRDKWADCHPGSKA